MGKRYETGLSLFTVYCLIPLLFLYLIYITLKLLKQNKIPLELFIYEIKYRERIKM